MSWWLTAVGALPLVGVVALLSLPAARVQAIKVVALATSLVTLGAVIWMSTEFATGGPRFQFVQHANWIEAFGAHYALGADGIALVLIGLTAVLTPVVVLASWHESEAGRHSPKTFFALVLSLETMLIGSFAATDLFLFYVFFEAMLVPMYFLIGRSGGARASYASVKFLLYSLLGGLLMLASVIGVYVVTSDHLPAGSFDFAAVSQVHRFISPTIENWLFAGFFIAFAIKAPLWPFHTWLPDAAAEAPTGGAVLLVGVMDKVGTFGFLRWCLPLFPHAVQDWAPYILALSVISILYGALLAIGQRDLKRLVAYTSVSHFGFIALGIFAFTSQGQSGATLYMVNHGFVTGALFLVVGFLASRRGSRLIADFGGVAKVAPWLAGSFLLAGMASLGLPGLNQFVSEFLVLVGTFTRHRAFAVTATLGIVLASLYILLMYRRTMHGPVLQGNEDLTDLNTREAWAIAPVLVLTVLLGVYPKPVLDVINPAVNATMQQTGQHDPRPPLKQPSPTSPKPAQATTLGVHQ